MNHNTDQVRLTVEAVIGGRCLRSYKQAPVSRDKPFAVLSMTSVPHYMDRTGYETVSLVTYTLRLHGEGQVALDDMADAVSAALGRLGIRRTSMVPLWDEPTYGPGTLMTFSMLMDRRGHIFSSQ